MAKKRMLSLEVVDTDVFMDMPASTQLYYFHLAMRADDEGFIGNPKKILRLIGGQEDDLKILIIKRFIILFDSGVVVVRHWLMHNIIRMDRFNPTSYADEKNTLFVQANKAYDKTETIGLPIGNQALPQVNQSKSNLIEFKIFAQTGFERFWSEYPRKVSKQTAMKAWHKIKLTQELLDLILEALKRYKLTDQWVKDNGQFIPHPATWLNQCRWEDQIETVSNTGRKVDSF